MWSKVATIVSSSFHAATITVTWGHCPVGHGPLGGSGEGTR